MAAPLTEITIGTDGRTSAQSNGDHSPSPSPQMRLPAIAAGQPIGAKSKRKKTPPLPVELIWPPVLMREEEVIASKQNIG